MQSPWGVTHWQRPREKTDNTSGLETRGAEFVRRWALHILPKGYTKTRRFGGYSNRHRARYLTACRELLSTAEPAPPTSESASPAAETPPEYRCPNCASLLTCTRATDRPGWSSVMSSSHCPSWYRPRWYNKVWYDDG